MPLSVTPKTSRARSRATFSLVTSSRTLPRSVNFTALSIRFSSAARMRMASPITASGRSGAIVAADSISLRWARASSDAASDCANARGRIRSRRRTRPRASARTASTISEVSMVRCSPVLLIAIAHSRSRGGSPAVASSSPSARMPVSGVLISCASSASVVSMARRDSCGARLRRGCGRRVRRAADAFRRALAIAPNRGQIATLGQESPTIRRMSAGVAPRPRNSRRPVARVDFDSFFPSSSRTRRWW